MASDFIKLTSEAFAPQEPTIPDAGLDPNDPIHNMKKLAGIGNLADLNEYTGYNSIPETEGSNCSKTAIEKVNYQKENDVKPGSPEWFRLWFSKPYMTGEKPW